MDCEATFGIIHKSEVLARLLDADDIHEAGWVGRIGAHFAIDFDEALHDDLLDLAAIEGVFETVITRMLALIPRRVWHVSLLLPYRFLMNTINGMQSLNLCGPGEAFGA